MLAAGTMLGPCKILAPLGARGTGEVHCTRDTHLRCDVTVKVIPAELARDPERIKRFERGGEPCGALSRPNVCEIRNVGAHDGLQGRVLAMVPVRVAPTLGRDEYTASS